MSTYQPPSDQEILNAAKHWFKDKIIAQHMTRTKKLAKPSSFKINPLTAPYLSAFLTGEVSSEGIAKSLVYARILSSSISTSLGQNLQSFISEVLGASGSITSGIDIEFTDKLDGRKKYAQLKLGPNTINKDDVKTIDNHFKEAMGKAKQNRVLIPTEDLVVGVLYGAKNELSANYKNLRDKLHYTVLVGDEFWYRLTGDSTFFARLVQSISETFIDVDGSEMIDSVIQKLANSKEIKQLTSLATKNEKNTE